MRVAVTSERLSGRRCAALIALCAVGCGSDPAEPHDGHGTHDAGVDAADASGEASADAPGAETAGDAGALYDVDGPEAFTVEEDDVAVGERSYHVTTYRPSSAGSHPLVTFWCGTQQKAAGYVPYAERLASYGITMAIADDPGLGTQTSELLPAAVYLVDTWAPAKLGASLDASRVGLSGHSRGGALTIFAAAGDLKGKVAAWLGLDAVDNPIQNAVLARSVLPDLGVPGAFLGAGVPTLCSQTNENYETLFPLAPSPSVLVAFAGASHTQFETASGCLLCTVCTPHGSADDGAVVATAVRYYTAFFARELLADHAVGSAFEGAGAAADLAAGVVTITSK